jgi:hypothetical protein
MHRERLTIKVSPFVRDLAAAGISGPFWPRLGSPGSRSPFLYQTAVYADKTDHGCLSLAMRMMPPEIGEQGRKCTNGVASIFLTFEAGLGRASRLVISYLLMVNGKKS